MADDAKDSAANIQKAYEELPPGLSPIAKFIRELFEGAFKDTSNAAETSATASSNAFADFFNGLVSQGAAAFNGLSSLIANWWNGLPGTIRNILGGNAASVLAGAAGAAGSAASRASAPNAQATGIYGRYGAPSSQVPFAKKTPAPNAMNTFVGSTVGGGGGGGRAAGGGADKAANDAKRAADEAQREAQRVADVVKDQEFITKQKGIQTKFAQLIFEAEQAADPIRARQLQTVEALVLAGNETARLLEEETNRTAQLAIARTRQGEAEAIRQEGMLAVLDLQLQQQKNFDEIITGLDLELALKTATTEQAREQLRLEAEIAKLKGQGFTPEQIGAITAKKTELTKPKTDQQNITEKIATLKKEITDLTSISNIAITSAEGIGNAFAQSFQGLISGTMTAKEALGSFFKSVADMFLEMAAQIIAKQITMIILQTILKALGAVAGGGGGGGGGGGASSGPGIDPGAFNIGPAGQAPGAIQAANGATFANGIAKFASGGAFTNSVVSSPTMFKFADGGAMRTGLMGEAGPEAIMPLSRGADGSLGVQANGLREAMDRQQSGGSGSPVLNMSFQSTSINGVEYVSRDQLESAMAETRRASTRDGAKRGMTMTLDRIQNSSSTRRRVGI